MSSLLESISMFPHFLEELIRKNKNKTFGRLKFLCKSRVNYGTTINTLLKFFKWRTSLSDYQFLIDEINELEDEAGICELLLYLVQHGERSMDLCNRTLKEVIIRMGRLFQMSEQRLNVQGEIKLDETALLLYDLLQRLREIRKMVMHITTTYHVPYFYDTEKYRYPLRSSLLVVFKNLNTSMMDLITMNEALWYVRHYETIDQQMKLPRAEQIDELSSDSTAKDNRK